MTKFIKSVQILLFLLFLVFITKNVYCDDSDDECYFSSDDENDTGSDTEESDVEPPAEERGYWSDDSLDGIEVNLPNDIDDGGHESDWSDDSLDGINVDNLPGHYPTDTDDDDDGNDDDDE